jgi:hypothetical protein
VMLEWKGFVSGYGVGPTSKRIRVRYLNGGLCS